MTMVKTICLGIKYSAEFLWFLDGWYRFALYSMVLVTLEKFDFIFDSQTFSRSGRKTLKDKRLIRNNSSQSGRCKVVFSQTHPLSFLTPMK